MQNSQQTSKSDAVRIAELTRATGHRQKLLIKTIGDIFDIDGLEAPTKAITDLTTYFFTSLDPYDVDKENNPVPLHKSLNSDVVRDLVYISNEMIMFFIKLKNDFDCLKELNSEMNILTNSNL